MARRQSLSQQRVGLRLISIRCPNVRLKAVSALEVAVPIQKVDQLPMVPYHHLGARPLIDELLCSGKTHVLNRCPDGRRGALKPSRVDITLATEEARVADTHQHIRICFSTSPLERFSQFRHARRGWEIH